MIKLHEQNHKTAKDDDIIISTLGMNKQRTACMIGGRRIARIYDLKNVRVTDDQKIVPSMTDLKNLRSQRK